VSVVKVDWIFQVHLQYVPFDPVAVHGVDVEIFGVVEKTKFAYWERLGKRVSVKVVRV